MANNITLTPLQDDSSKHIIDMINAAADIQKSQAEFKKSLALDQIKRQRDLQQQGAQYKMWSSMMDGSGGGTPDGQANSQTPNQVGVNPSSPQPSPMAAPTPQPSPQVPPNGYSESNPPPMSMWDQSQQPAVNAKDAAQQTSMAQPVQAQPIQAQPIQAQAQPQMPTMMPQGAPATLESPIGVPLPPPKGRVTMGLHGPVIRPAEPKDMLYAQIYNKWKSGTPLSSGEAGIVRDYLGVKNSVLPGMDTQNMSPDDLQAELQQRDPGHYNFLQSVKDGKVNLSGRSSKEMNRVIEEVQSLWPGTDLTTVNSRMKVRNDFTSGTTARNITALNTAIHHADTAYDQINSLDNGDFKKFNNFGNWIKSNVGDPRVDVLKSTLGVLNREVNKAISAGIVTNEDKNAFESSLNAAQSKQVATDVINNYIHLISGRTQPLLENWQSSFGPDSTFQVLKPSAQKILEKHGFQYDTKTGDIQMPAGGGNGNETGPTIYNPTTGKTMRLSPDGKSWI